MELLFGKVLLSAVAQIAVGSLIPTLVALLFVRHPKKAIVIGLYVSAIVFFGQAGIKAYMPIQQSIVESQDPAK